jgi:two-component system LytT family response regulator
MRTLIIDDERLARTALRRLLRPYKDIEVAGEAANSEEGLRAISRFKPDLVLMDVEMPGRNGFELLEQLEDVPLVIFTTAFDTYAVKAFEESALDYLMKPISSERLEAALDRARKALAAAAAQPAGAGASGSAPRQIFVRDGKRCWIVRLADIRLLESEGNYTRLHFGEDAPLVFRSLSALEQRLTPDLFFRSNRSQVINLQWIESVHNEIDGRLVVKLTKGELIEVSRRQSQRLRQLLSL